MDEIESEVEDLILRITNELRPVITQERPDQMTYVKMLDLLRGLEMKLLKVDSKVSTEREYREALGQVNYIRKMIDFEVEYKEKETKK